MIYFNRPALVGNELKYIQDAVAQGMLCGDGNIRSFVQHG